MGSGMTNQDPTHVHGFQLSGECVCGHITPGYGMTNQDAPSAAISQPLGGQAVSERPETIEISLDGLRSALRELSDTLDEDEGPVILAWSADRLAEALFVHLRPKVAEPEGDQPATVPGELLTPDDDITGPTASYRT